MSMKNPPHPGLSVKHDCLAPLGLSVTKGSGGPRRDPADAQRSRQLPPGHLAGNGAASRPGVRRRRRCLAAAAGGLRSRPGATERACAERQALPAGGMIRFGRYVATSRSTSSVTSAIDSSTSTRATSASPAASVRGRAPAPVAPEFFQMRLRRHRPGRAAIDLVDTDLVARAVLKRDRDAHRRQRILVGIVVDAQRDPRRRCEPPGSASASDKKSAISTVSFSSAQATT